MNKLTFFTIIFLLLSCRKPFGQFQLAVLDVKESQQLVIVRSPNAMSTSAQLGRYEASKGGWVQVGSTIPVSLGRSGLAYASEFLIKSKANGKREGDGKSPGGLFSFGKIFGYAPASEVRFNMPYVHADEALECVDDGQSKFYNQLVDNRLVEKDWSSSEFMRRPDHQYRWGLVVNHNTPAQAGDGSCIFLHIWREPNAATSGCTAMSETDLLELLHWLDPAKKPVLLQVLEEDYAIFQKELGLPK